MRRIPANEFHRDTVDDSATAELDFDGVAAKALQMARRTGRVTTVMLVEQTSISMDEARDVCNQLVADGLLMKKGKTRGTHYVVTLRPGRADAYMSSAEQTR